MCLKTTIALDFYADIGIRTNIFTFDEISTFPQNMFLTLTTGLVFCLLYFFKSTTNQCK